MLEGAGCSIKTVTRGEETGSLALQYIDRSGEWYELEFPTHQVKRLIDLLIPFQMEIERDKD